MTKHHKPRVSAETFDDFLVEQGLLESCEDQAIQEIIVDQPAEVAPQNP